MKKSILFFTFFLASSLSLIAQDLPNVIFVLQANTDEYESSKVFLLIENTIYYVGNAFTSELTARNYDQKYEICGASGYSAGAQVDFVAIKSVSGLKILSRTVEGMDNIDSFELVKILDYDEIIQGNEIKVGNYTHE